MDKIIVTDTGFSVEDWTGTLVGPEDLHTANDPIGLDLPSDATLDGLEDTLSRLTLIRVGFPSFADGRGFTIAAQLRRMGYTGRLRAAGHVIADQYAMARRSGFDEVEIDETLAARQPEDQWLARANWQAHHYQARLRG